MGTKCEPGATSGASSSSSDDDPDYDSEVFDLSLTEKMHQRKRLVQYYGIHRDKESLLEELLSLQEALSDQKYHLARHKGHHNDMEAENRRLELQIEFLETSGLQAALTGTLTKLRAKLRAAEFRIADLESTCAINADEMRNLKMDSQFMKTQEAVVARELYALEVRRLQRAVFHLGRLYKKVCHDNEEAARLKETVATLTAKLPGLRDSLSVVKESLQDLAAKSSEWKSKGAAAAYQGGSDNARFTSLQQESKSIMDQLLNEQKERSKLSSEAGGTNYLARMAEKEAREKQAHDQA